MSASRNPHTIPARDRVECVQCGDTIDARAHGNGELIRGVAVNRAQGGANVITLMEHTRRYLCRFCIAARKRGHAWTQPSLFDDE